MRLPSLSVRVIAGAVVAAAVATGAQAQSLLTFEDLCYSSVARCGTASPTVLFSGGPILPQYAGFSWTSFRALDLGNYTLYRPDPDPAATGNGGYPLAPSTYGTVLGLAFGDLVVRRPVGSTFTAFQFDDLMIGSGWTSGMTLSVVGTRLGAPVFAQSLTLSATNSTALDLPDLWVDQLTFAPNFTPPGYTDPYGSAQFNGGTPYQSFWFDNVAYRVQTTPEPATLALVGGGLLALGLTVRRRRHG